MSIIAILPLVFLISVIIVSEKTRDDYNFWLFPLIISCFTLLILLPVISWMGRGPINFTDLHKLQLFNESEFPNCKGSLLEAEVLRVKNKVETYLSTHSDVAISINKAMRSFTIIKGMNQDQVVLLIGSPSEKEGKTVRISIWKTVEAEIWKYHPIGKLRQWADDYGKFTFKDGILIKIEYAKWDYGINY